MHRESALLPDLALTKVSGESWLVKVGRACHAGRQASCKSGFSYWMI